MRGQEKKQEATENDKRSKRLGTENLKYTSNKFFPEMVSVILGCSRYAAVCSRAHFSDHFGCN